MTTVSRDDTLIAANGLNWQRDATGWDQTGHASRRMIGRLKKRPRVLADSGDSGASMSCDKENGSLTLVVASQLGRRIRDHWADHHQDWDNFCWFGSSEVTFDPNSPIGRVEVRYPTDTNGQTTVVRFGRVWLDIEAMLHRAFLPDGAFFGERGRVPYCGGNASEWPRSWHRSSKTSCELYRVCLLAPLPLSGTVVRA